MTTNAILILSSLIAALLHRAAGTDSCSASVTSTVESVRIHGNKAEVTRSFEFPTYELDTYCSIRVDGLTAQLEDRSVRVKGVGDAEIIESSVSSQSMTRDVNPAYVAQLAYLQRLLSALTADAESVQSLITRSLTQKDYLGMYTKATIGGKSGSQSDENTGSSAAVPSVQSISEVLKFQDSMAEEMDHKIAAAKLHLAELNEKQRDVQSQLDSLRKDGIYTPYYENGKLVCYDTIDCSDPNLSISSFWPATVASKSVAVRVRTGTDEDKLPLKFSVTYLAGPARWYPEYDIRLEGDAMDTQERDTKSRTYQIELDYYAAVEQQTHENWNGVSMSLLTTNPSWAAHHPEPNQRGVYYEEHSPFTQPVMMMDAAPEMMSFAAVGGDGRKRAKRSKARGMNYEEDMVMESGAVPQMMMESRSASVERAGDLGASFQFKLQHPVNISSYIQPGVYRQGGTQVSGPQKLLVSTLSLSSTVFSFAVPSADTRAYLRAWGDLPKEGNVPLLKSGVSSFRHFNGGNSGGGRIFIQGTYSGETSVDEVQPGGVVRLSLGFDKNVEVKYTPVFAKHSNTEEDKSSWFVTDKTKYRVKTEEFSIYAKSTHSTPTLLILAESIPVSTEEEVKVDIVSPEPRTIVNFDDTHSSGGDAFLEAIFAIVGKAPPQDMTKGNHLHVFYSKKTGHMYWARWLNPSDTIVSSLKYKLTWPDEKNIVVA